MNECARKKKLKSWSRGVFLSDIEKLIILKRKATLIFLLVNQFLNRTKDK